MGKPSDLYGFGNEDEAGVRKVGQTTDNVYVSHVPMMPRLTRGLGYLRMSFTAKLMELLRFYDQRKHDSLERNPTISGGYTNNHIIPLDIINLDKFQSLHQLVKIEMQDVLQWWTQQRLRSTAIRGIRIYRRNAMLINHVDRQDTHLASAVLQVAQSVDDDGGWPLEVVGQDGGTYEVYLQPGEMVLYEGGKFL